MGLMGWISGARPLLPISAPKPPAELRAALLGLNRDTAPFIVREDVRAKAELIAEWRIVDNQWYEVFAKASLQRTFRILMRLDAEAGELRAVDEAWSVGWHEGIPILNVDAGYGRPLHATKSYGAAHAYTETLPSGGVQRYKFTLKELKAPLQSAAAECGWIWKPVSFRTL